LRDPVGQIERHSSARIAQHNLGACYANSDSPNKDLETAAFWFHKGAEHGLKLSMASLSRIYEFGEGVERDIAKASYWKDKADGTEDLLPY
jgi:uncharacterized protein